MTKDEVLQRIIKAMGEAINLSPAFNAACEDLDKVGLQPCVSININVFNSESATVDQQASDADFLRSLRIQPDLEAR